MKLESQPLVIAFDPFDTRTEADPLHAIGEAIRLADQRIFRHLKAGGSNISKGKLQLAPAPKANHHNMATAAAALGAVQVTVTPGATAVVADEYSEGYLGVNDATGEGTHYKVSGHAAADASTAFVVKLFDPIKGTALTSSSETSLVHNAFQGVVEGTAVTRRGAGVPLISISAGDFGWGQTKGVAFTLCDTATTLGAPQIVGAVAGSIKDQTDILGASSERTIAWADIMAGVDTEYRPVSLAID
jgi:hypothetical protein